MLNQLYPPTPVVSIAVEHLSRWWEKEGHKHMQDICDHVGLDFAEKEIVAYIHSGPHTSSDPINISTTNSLALEDVLVHELIHRLLTYNNEGFNEDVEMPKRYPDESVLCAVHVGVHSVLTWHYLHSGRPDLLKLDIELSERFPDYKRAWEIVEEEGHENIIQYTLKSVDNRSHSRSV